MYSVTFTTNFHTSHTILMYEFPVDGESPFIDQAMEEFSIYASESGMDRDTPNYHEDLEIYLESYSPDTFTQLRNQQELCRSMQGMLRQTEDSGETPYQEHIDIYHQAVSKMLELTNQAYPDF